ncbi:MAG: DUF2630 family protein [Pseudomonadota bacterium]|nr:DUF2630 family protein [Pseudomonadota bacterium]
MNDQSILQHITALVSEEQRLRSDTAEPGSNAAPLLHIEQQLDQCWDLLRQRRAKREFGEDPAAAKARGTDTVERYQG